MKHLRVCRTEKEGEEVAILLDGSLLCALPYQVAYRLGKVLQGLSKEVENSKVTPQRIQDQALLMRSGVPFALTDSPKFLEEALVEAQWGKELRTVPLASKVSIPSGEHVSVPKIFNSSSDASKGKE